MARVMSGALSETRKLQLEFWKRFSDALEGSSFPSRVPAAKSWCYLPIGTSRARVVAVVHFRMAARSPSGDNIVTVEPRRHASENSWLTRATRFRRARTIALDGGR